LGPLAHRIARLGSDEHAALARAAERLADNFFRSAGGIDIGGVDQIDAGINDKIDEAAHVGEPNIADLGEAALAPESHRPHRQRGDLEARIAKPAVFHEISLSDRYCLTNGHVSP
jgi:hypothetical protein